MVRRFWFIWATLTWLSAMLCTAGCLLPFWLKGSIRLFGVDLQITKEQKTLPRPDMEEIYSDLGLYRRCVFPLYRGDGSVRVDSNCGHYRFTDVPHVCWKVGLLCLSIACCGLFFLTFFLFFIGFCLDLLQHKRVISTCQGVQTIAGLLGLTTCLLYPFGWANNREVTQICGKDARMFSTGRCYIGWAYVLTCAGSVMTLLTTILPFLMNYHLTQEKRNLMIKSALSTGETCLTPDTRSLREASVSLVRPAALTASGQLYNSQSTPYPIHHKSPLPHSSTSLRNLHSARNSLVSTVPSIMDLLPVTCGLSPIPYMHPISIRLDNYSDSISQGRGYIPHTPSPAAMRGLNHRAYSNSNGASPALTPTISNNSSYTLVGDPHKLYHEAASQVLQEEEEASSLPPPVVSTPASPSVFVVHHRKSSTTSDKSSTHQLTQSDCNDLDDSSSPVNIDEPL